MIGKDIGPYRIMEQIGQGGMGVVYRGLHLKLDQEVAIKVLAPEFSQEPAMRTRFITEAKIQAKISHPNVVNILNYVEDDGNLFLVMEYIRGETLENRLLRAGRVEDGFGICLDVLSALEYMHSRGIVHRDIKPGNIMLLEDGSAKVMDFGIAKVAGQKGQTQTGMRLGTLWYMSPEQVLGEEASVSSDIYSVGVTLYQMATGRVPYSSDSEYKVMKAHLEERPSPPWEINHLVSQQLGSVILKAIAKDKKDRYQSAREFAQALRNSERKIPELPDLPGAAAGLPDQGKGAVAQGPLPERKLKKRYLCALALCIGALLLAMGLLLGQREEKSGPPIPTVFREAPPPVAPSAAEAPLRSAPPPISAAPAGDAVGTENASDRRPPKKQRPGVSRLVQHRPPVQPPTSAKGVSAKTVTSAKPIADAGPASHAEPARRSSESGDKSEPGKPVINEGGGWEIR